MKKIRVEILFLAAVFFLSVSFIAALAYFVEWSNG